MSMGSSGRYGSGKEKMHLNHSLTHSLTVVCISSYWQKDGYTTILLVQGFNALCVKASAIAQLFGCYGDVLKVG